MGCIVARHARQDAGTSVPNSSNPHTAVGASPLPEQTPAVHSKDANHSTSTSTSQYYSARIDWMMQNRSKYATQAEFDVACSKSHWSTVERPGGSRSEMGPENQHGVSSSACSSGAERDEVERELEEVLKANREFYKQQTQHKMWGWTFNEEEDRLYEIGEKIGQGGEAEIYAGIRTARREGDRRSHVVFKVFPRGISLQDLVTLWPEPVFEQIPTRIRWFQGLRVIEHVMLLPDDGRIAMVMERAWGDLRRCIDMRKQANHNQGPPFEYQTTLNLMRQIAFQMMELHGLNVVHRDLKASNVLMAFQNSPSFERDLSASVESNLQPHLRGFLTVSDFECALGVLGTGFWRAPEVLLAMKDPQKRNSPGLFTKMSDVYSYGMVCYEIVTGFLPFEREGFVGPGTPEDRDRVINGLRPSFPDDVVGWVKEFITRCWHQDGDQRPTLDEISSLIIQNGLMTGQI